MKKLSVVIAAAALSLFALGGIAHADQEPKNLEVLSKDLGKTLGKGMKEMTKGLGVKCTACHIKGKWDKDDVEAKVKARAFFEAVVGEPDAKKKDAALKALLPHLKIKEVKDAKQVWAGVGMFKKKGAK